MVRYTLSSSQLFFLLIFFRAFSLIETAPMQYREDKFPTFSGKSKYTFDLVGSDEYQIPRPSFDAAAGKLNFEVVGPPGEIMLYVRRTKVSWDNRTIYTDHFIHQPKIRGTISILLSCIFTLFLCVWTAFHANIEPVREESEGYPWIRKRLYHLYRRWRKVLWSVIIIIFPESPLFLALVERKTANWICKLIDNELKKEIISSEAQGLVDKPNGFLSKLVLVFRWKSSSRPKVTWSKKPQLGYFALMGGFAIRKEDGKLKTLTLYGVWFVCRHLGSADKLARKIDDKNDASGLARCLVVFQVIWIIIQIICRYRAHLSVTLLETHTVIHAVCALATYITWFEKPFNVNHPIELDLDPGVVKILEELNGESNEDLTNWFNMKEDQPLQPLPGQPLPGLPLQPPPSLDNLIEWFRGERRQTFPGPENLTGVYLRGKRIPLLTERAGQTKLASMVPSRQIWLGCLITPAAMAVYGGLHVWALKAGHFPTLQEKFFWLLALCSTAAGGICCSFILLSLKVFDPKKVIKWLFKAIFLVAFIFSAVGRLYLVGESFASMRDPSAKAFRIVSWTNLAII